MIKKQVSSNNHDLIDGKLEKETHPTWSCVSCRHLSMMKKKDTHWNQSASPSRYHRPYCLVKSGGNEVVRQVGWRYYSLRKTTNPTKRRSETLFEKEEVKAIGRQKETRDVTIFQDCHAVFSWQSFTEDVFSTTMITISIIDKSWITSSWTFQVQDDLVSKSIFSFFISLWEASYQSSYSAIHRHHQSNLVWNVFHRHSSKTETISAKNSRSQTLSTLSSWS